MLLLFRNIGQFLIALLLILTPGGDVVVGWQANFQPSIINITMGHSQQVMLRMNDIELPIIRQPQRFSFHLLTGNASTHQLHPLVNISPEDSLINVTKIDTQTRAWRGNITINAQFLGKDGIIVGLLDSFTNFTTPPTTPSRNSTLEVIVMRPERVIDKVFLGSVILLMSLLYINFGAALDITVLRALVTRPVGPCIGLILQCICMPLLSYGLGKLIFPNEHTLQLGLFFTGISPSGGASNTWSAVLGGNIHLSVLMTTLSNLLAFATMPFWIFTLGGLIFQLLNMPVPYAKIFQSTVSLLVPLFIGMGIQRCSPRLTRILVRLLKPISLCLILFIIIFAIVTNFYIFELFSWQIIVAGMMLPGLGYLSAWIVAKVFHQNTADALTIAIETGIQNTGITIFFLRSTLQPPVGDLTTVVPVAVAIMTPLPLLGIYIYKRCCNSKVIIGET